MKPKNHVLKVYVKFQYGGRGFVNLEDCRLRRSLNTTQIKKMKCRVWKPNVTVKLRKEQKSSTREMKYTKKTLDILINKQNTFLLCYMDMDAQRKFKQWNWIDTNVGSE